MPWDGNIDKARESRKDSTKECSDGMKDYYGEDVLLLVKEKMVTMMYMLNQIQVKVIRMM